MTDPGADDDLTVLREGAFAGQDLNAVLGLHEPATFCFVMHTKALESESIFEGDLIVCRRDLKPHNGDLVVVSRQRRFLLRYLRSGPEPALYLGGTADIRDLQHYQLFGVVVAVLRRTTRPRGTALSQMTGGEP
ncbi:MAG: hypothetical protein IJ228_10515 [Succinivibrio sp.]|nr:hypothetical protein [Succinivibrio sp.]